MKIHFLICNFLLLFPCLSFSQEAGEAGAVKSVIENLFEAMTAGDSAMAMNSFAPKVTSATIYTDDKTGMPAIRLGENIDSFMRAIGASRKEVWYEEIWGLRIMIDGEFAQAWCDYAFYIDKTFSHCGVDAFHLFRDRGAWKIFHIADTRKKTGCKIPRAIRDKHK